MSIFDYRDPIIAQKRKGTPDDPFVDLNEQQQVINGKVVLAEIPDEFTRVSVSGEGITWIETNGEPTENQYKVDYTLGVIFFHSIREGLRLTFNYKGTGAYYFPASRIWDKYDGNNITKTLEDVVEQANSTLEITERFVHKGNYDTNTIYYNRNIVNYDNATYMCINSSREGIQGITPSDDGINWRLIVTVKQAILDANTATQNANTAAANANATNDAIILAENDRVAAENTRVSNENTRINAENTREMNEGNRISAENTRETNETNRQNNEQNRINAENTRESNEITRENNEIIRQNNESTRQSNEITRENNEAIRQTNEQDRQTAINNLNHKGDYDNLTTYYSRNIVYYQGSTYMCIADAPVGTPPTDSIYWRKLTSYRWKGVYSSTDIYEYGDTVVDAQNLNVYQCIITSSQNIPLTDTTSWQKVVSVEDVVNSANTATTNANDKAIYAQTQGDYAKTQGDYAKNQGDYAKNIGDNLVYKDNYDSATIYNAGNIVFYKNGSYMCLNDGVQNITPDDTLNWKLLAEGINWKGDYDAVVQYIVNDIVFYQGSSYICIQNSLGNDPTNTIYWKLFAERGSGKLVPLRNTTTLASDSTSVTIGIDQFSQINDILLVFQNSTYIEENQDYTISIDNLFINKVSGTWAAGTTFNFIAFKNIKTDIVTVDPAQIQNDSIEDIKLHPTNKIGVLSNLNTSDKTSVVSAINELNVNKIKNAGGTPEVLSDLKVNIPLAGIIGRLFIATDTGEIYRDNGTTWDLVAASRDEFDAHKADTANPHQVTAAQVGAVNKSGDTMTGILTVPNLKAQINISSSSNPSAWPVGFVAGVVYNNGYPVNYGTIFSYKGTSGNSCVQILQAWPGTDGGEAYLYIRSSRDNGADVFGPWRKVWSENNDGAGSGLDADKVRGYVPVNKSGDTMTGTLVSAGSTGVIADDTSNKGRIEVRSASSSDAALMTFHRPGAYASYFGIDTDNQWKVGGWSAGAVAHKVWHAGNDGAGSGLDADKVDGLHVTGSGTPGLRKITVSTANPSGGVDGDVWFKYS